jgi:hypothetical protein
MTSPIRNGLADLLRRRIVVAPRAGAPAAEIVERLRG